jgi:hypothetical protein
VLEIVPKTVDFSNGMIVYRAIQNEGDFSPALSASNTASCQSLATRASAAGGSVPNECPTPDQERSPHGSPSFKVKLERIH